MTDTRTIIFTKETSDTSDADKVKMAYGDVSELKGNEVRNVKQPMSFQSSVILVQAYRSVKSVGNYAISSYGNLTGDNIRQNEINTTLSVLSSATSIASGFAVGGVAGGIASVIAEGTKISINLAQQYNAARKENLATSGYVARIGAVKESGGR